jgi:DNA invertase Pin-like site-specific DNA recombinase
VTKGKGKRVALYLRVSTSEQTIENQRRELRAVAERHGWQISATFADDGISGAKGRDKRPGFDALMRAIGRREIDLVATWSVDRLSRSLSDLVTFLGEIRGKSVDLYLHSQGLDTSTPAGKALFQMMGVFAELERSIIRERVLSGLARAREQGKHIGRPRTNAKTEAAIRKALAKGDAGIHRIAARFSVGAGTVQRIRAEMASAAARS